MRLIKPPGLYYFIVIFISKKFYLSKVIFKHFFKKALHKVYPGIKKMKSHVFLQKK